MQQIISKYKIYIGVLTLGIIWGSTWLAIKFGLEDAPPFFSAALRFVLAFLVLYIWQIIKGYIFPRNWKYWKNAIFISLFMFIIPYAMVYIGEMYISSGLSAVLFSTQSLFVVVFASSMLKAEKVNLQKVIGLFIGFIGLVLIFQGQIIWDETWGFIGMLALLFGAACAAFGLVLLSKQKHKVKPIPEVMTHLGITAIAFVLLSLIFESPPEEIFTSKLWISVVYLAILGTAVGFVLYYWIAKQASAFLTSFSIFVSPVFAVFLGWLVLNETISAFGILGAILVIIGIGITQIKKNNQHPNKVE